MLPMPMSPQMAASYAIEFNNRIFSVLRNAFNIASRIHDPENVYIVGGIIVGGFRNGEYTSIYSHQDEITHYDSVTGLTMVFTTIFIDEIRNMLSNDALTYLFPLYAAMHIMHNGAVIGSMDLFNFTDQRDAYGFITPLDAAETYYAHQHTYIEEPTGYI